MGYKPLEIKIEINQSDSRNFQLYASENLIDEVNVVADKKDQNIRSNEMSINKLQMKTITKIPALMGEVDILRSIQMLPGVHSSGEAALVFM